MEVSDKIKRIVYSLVPDTPDARETVDVLIEKGIITERALRDFDIWYTYRMKLKTVEKKMHAVYDTTIELGCTMYSVYKLKDKFEE